MLMRSHPFCPTNIVRRRRKAGSRYCPSGEYSIHHDNRQKWMTTILISNPGMYHIISIRLHTITTHKCLPRFGLSFDFQYEMELICSNFFNLTGFRGLGSCYGRLDDVSATFGIGYFCWTFLTDACLNLTVMRTSRVVTWLLVDGR